MDISNDYDSDGNNIVPCPICLSAYCPSKEDGKCPEEDEFVKAMTTPLEEVKATCCKLCSVQLEDSFPPIPCEHCTCHTEKADRAIPEWDDICDVALLSGGRKIYVKEYIDQLLTTREAEARREVLNEVATVFNNSQIVDITRYAFSRGAGHTYALIKGVENTPNTLFIVANKEQGRDLGLRKEQVYSLGEANRLFFAGRRHPVVIDHFALTQMVNELGRKLKTLTTNSKETACEHDFPRAIRKGRASYECPTCHKDISMAWFYWMDAIKD